MSSHKKNQTPQGPVANASYASLIGPDPTQDIQFPTRSSGVGISSMKNAGRKSTRTEAPPRTGIVYVVETSISPETLTWWQKMLGYSQSPVPDSYIKGLNFSDDCNIYYPKICNPTDQISFLYPTFSVESGLDVERGDIVEVEYYDNYRRCVGLGGLLVPTGKVTKRTLAGNGTNSLCEFLKGNCKPPRPSPSGSATTSVEEACGKMGLLPFEKDLPQQYRTPPSTREGTVYPRHPLTGLALPDDVFSPTTPAEENKLRKVLGINSAMQAGRSVMGKTRGHKGSDFVYGAGARTDTRPVKAVLDGDVYAIGSSKENGKLVGWGNWIILDHRPYYVTEAKGKRTDGPIYTIYAHLKSPFTLGEGNLLVKQGKKVQAGETIAIGNSTGTSTGGHLHLEIVMSRTINGSPRVKPVKFFTYKFKKKGA